MNEVEEAKKRGYVVFKSSQRASRLGPYSSWCKDTLSPQIYVQITGKGARAEIDLIFVPYDREQVSDALREAITRLYQANADGDEHFVQKACTPFLPGGIYHTVKCKTADQAERIAKGYVEIYSSIIAPVRTSPVKKVL